MIEITFRYKPEDHEAFSDYMARQSEDGKRIGRQSYWNTHFYNVAIASLLSFPAWAIFNDRSLGLYMFFLILLAGELLTLV